MFSNACIQATSLAVHPAPACKRPTRSTSWGSLHKANQCGSSNTGCSSRSAPASPHRLVQSSKDSRRAGPQAGCGASSAQLSPVYLRSSRTGGREQPSVPSLGHDFPALLLDDPVTAHQQQKTKRLPVSTFADVAVKGSCHHSSTAARHHTIQQTDSIRGYHEDQQQLLQSHQQHQAGLQALLQQLAEMHPWCPADLAEEVLCAVNNDAAAAAAALCQLAPADSPQHFDSSSSRCKSGNEQRAGTEAQQTAAAAATDRNSTAAQSLQVQPSTDDKAALGDPDMYRQIRHEALKLSHKWQKALRK